MRATVDDFAHQFLSQMLIHVHAQEEGQRLVASSTAVFERGRAEPLHLGCVARIASPVAAVHELLLVLLYS